MTKMWQKHKKFMKGNKGFSLVELIIVIAIMAALVAVLAPQYIKWVEKSRVSADTQMAEILLTEVNTAIADAGVAGTTVTGGAITVTAAACSDTGNIGTYISTNIDAKWDSARVTNKAGVPGTTYTITYTATSVSGAWS